MKEPDAETEAIVVDLYPRLRRFAAVVGPIEMDPDDLVQDALAATISRVRIPELDDPSAYLRVVMVRLAANERRRLGRKRRAVQRVGTTGEEIHASYPSDLAELARLNPEDRALLFLTAVEGYTIAEAAVLLDRPAAALKMRRHRALRKLRGVIEGERDE